VSTIGDDLATTFFYLESVSNVAGRRVYNVRVNNQNDLARDASRQYQVRREVGQNTKLVNFLLLFKKLFSNDAR